MLAHLLVYLTLSERISGRTHCPHFLGLMHFDAQDIIESLSTMFLKRLQKKEDAWEGKEIVRSGLNL